MLENQFVTIMVVEDDPGHRKLIEKNLCRGGVDNPVESFENGQLALNYLKSQGKDQAQSLNRSMLMLLDLNMPVMNGVELLTILKQDDDLRKIPVIILTSTDDQREIEECYSLGCNLYIAKPVEFNSFSEIVRNLGLMIGVIAAPSL